jgi:hypothetical protein
MTAQKRSSVQYCSGFITAGMATSIMLFAQPADARVRIEPKIGMRLVFSDNVTASAGTKDAGIVALVEPGFSLSIDGGRTQGSLDYQLEFRQPIFAKGQQDKVRHNLAARGESEVIEDFFWMTGGALVTQVFRDRQGAISLNPDTLTDNLDNVASGYVEPIIRTRVNDFANFGAGARYTITEVKDRADNKLLLNDLSREFSAENFAFQPTSDSDAQNAYMQLDAGDYFQSFKWTVRGSWEREKRKYLNELYTSKSVIADVEVPLARWISVLGSAGWEDSRDIQDVIVTECSGLPRLIDPATGNRTDNAVIGLIDIDRSDAARNGTGGAFPCGPNEPPITRSGVIFDRSGFIWDAGLRLSPGRRTNITVRGGGRFGDVNINANAAYAISEHTQITGSYTTSLDSFGRLLSQSISGLPTSFRPVGSTVRPTLSPLVGFDTLTQQAFTGLLAINSATYLSRVAQLRLSHSYGRWNANAAIVHETRKLQSVQRLPGQAALDVSTVPDDKSIGFNFSAEREMSRKRYLFADMSVQNSKFALSEERNDWLYGAAVGYRIEFTPRIRGEARYLFSRRTSNLSGYNLSDNSISIGLEARF